MPYCDGQESSKDGLTSDTLHIQRITSPPSPKVTVVLILICHSKWEQKHLAQARNGHQTSHKKENASPEFFLSQFITKIPNIKCCYTLVFRWFKLWHCRSSTHKFLSHRIIDPIVPRERSIIQFLDSVTERKSQLQNKCNKATNSDKIWTYFYSRSLQWNKRNSVYHSSRYIYIYIYIYIHLFNNIFVTCNLHLKSSHVHCPFNNTTSITYVMWQSEIQGQLQWSGQQYTELTCKGWKTSVKLAMSHCTFTSYWYYSNE